MSTVWKINGHPVNSKNLWKFLSASAAVHQKNTETHHKSGNPFLKAIGDIGDRLMSDAENIVGFFGKQIDKFTTTASELPSKVLTTGSKNLETVIKGGEKAVDSATSNLAMPLAIGLGVAAIVGLTMFGGNYSRKRSRELFGESGFERMTRARFV